MPNTIFRFKKKKKGDTIMPNTVLYFLHSRVRSMEGRPCFATNHCAVLVTMACEQNQIYTKRRDEPAANQIFTKS